MIEESEFAMEIFLPAFVVVIAIGLFFGWWLQGKKPSYKTENSRGKK